VPLNLLLLAVYSSPEMGDTAKIVYAYVTYILHGMAFTAVGLPYSSLSAVMTQDQQERAVIATYRMTFAVVVTMSIVNIGVRPFVALFPTEQVGFMVVALVFGIVSTSLILVSYRASEERVQEPVESYGLGDVIPTLIKNDALVVLALAMFANTGVWVISNAVAVYYFKYVVGDIDLVSTFFWFMLPANVVGVIVGPQLTKRYGKRAIFIAGSVIVAVFYAARQVVPLNPLAVMIGVSMIGTFGQMLCAITQWGMVPDTVEYGHWKTGTRSEGIPFAFFSFMQKMGMAVGGALAAWVLSMSGYEANQDQSESALAAIEALFNIAPAVCSLLCAVALAFYRLDGEMFQKILRELEERAARKASASGGAESGR